MLGIENKDKIRPNENLQKFLVDNCIQEMHESLIKIAGVISSQSDQIKILNYQVELLSENLFAQKKRDYSIKVNRFISKLHKE